jgi:hypothetical protein
MGALLGPSVSKKGSQYMQHPGTMPKNLSCLTGKFKRQLSPEDSNSHLPTPNWPDFGQGGNHNFEFFAAPTLAVKELENSLLISLRKEKSVWPFDTETMRNPAEKSTALI